MDFPAANKSVMIQYDCRNRCWLGGSVPVYSEDAVDFQNLLDEVSADPLPSVQFRDFRLLVENAPVSYSVGVICTEPGERITVTFTPKKTEHRTEGIDRLTKLFTRETFAKRVDSCIQGIEKEPDCDYFIMYFDIQRLKAINDIFGQKEGNRLLCHIADVLADTVRDFGAACRINSNSDRFVLMTKCPAGRTDAVVEGVLHRISEFDLPYEIICNAGVYVLEEMHISAERLIDRAMMAQIPIKGSYTQRYNYYTEKLHREILTEQEITGMMKAAMKQKQFVVYYQPQYNHSTGMLVGTEALVRWNHPQKGIISPGIFIPVFEKNGFISTLDMYVFECVCIFLRKCLTNGITPVPVSANLTRHDIYAPNFIENMEAIRKKYDVPTDLLRVEITESAALGNSQYIMDAVRKLHDYGYIVEMDDFGSGYSSLNILKDIDFDVIKLDMRFLQNENSPGGKGGTILSSIVRMINWLGLPVIAEGVETLEQADFLGSICCDYIQGYLYSKPLPESEYEMLLSQKSSSAQFPQESLAHRLDTVDFWSNSTLEALIFSNFVGGAAIFEYKDGKTEILRVNEKYLTELGMNLTVRDVVQTNPLDSMDDYSRKCFKKALDAAIETRDEQECETWRTLHSPCCGEEKMCIRSTIRMIGRNKDYYLFYAMIRNITKEKELFLRMQNADHDFRMVVEQANIYFWEYTIATKEMRPCFRCMRDLGFPPVMENYPECAIEMGVFPPDYADMYRDWMRQIEQGVPSLEGVIPLTVGRVPFMVRYTTEFDEQGRPVKAYGSATLITGGESPPVS